MKSSYLTQYSSTQIDEKAEWGIKWKRQGLQGGLRSGQGQPSTNFQVGIPKYGLPGFWYQELSTRWNSVDSRSWECDNDAKQTRTNGSVVNVQSDQLAARYRCQAFNNLGSDSHVIKFVRRGKKMLRVLAINIFRRGGSYPDMFCSFVRRGKKMLHVLTMNTFRFAGSYSDILALPSCNNLLITSLFMREMNHQKSKI